MRETRSYGSVRGAAGNSRPYREPGPQADSRTAENSIFHSMTSSATASRVGGMSSPSALAVLRLMTSWNLVGLLDRKLTGLLAAEAIDVRGGPPVLIGQINSVPGRPRQRPVTSEPSATATMTKAKGRSQ
jgi:hypothetical protein